MLVAGALRRRIAPIGALIEAAAQIERGDYSVRVPERGGREVRALARTFNTMSARLSAIDSQRRSFLADVAHELRTPLAIMRGRLEAMLDGIHPRDDDHLRAMLGHAAALERLVGDVATVAAAETGALPLKLQQVDLAVLANSRRRGLRRNRAGGRRGDPRAGRCRATTVSGDAARLQQALSNLVANALRSGAYCRRDRRRPQRGGHRSRCATTARASLRTSSRTSSSRFVRGPDSAGSGLGLAIVADIAAAHGGSTAAASTPGAGTCVTLLLPAAGSPSTR